MLGRTIKIHLIEGTPNDIATAEIIASWTGKVFLVPQAKIITLAKQIEVRRAGVYILVGDDPKYPGKEKVYVGESDNVLQRLKQHNDSETKDFWSRTIIIVSKDENLTKSLIRYLESRLIGIIRQAGRATLDNGTNPESPKLPQSDVADMEYFLTQIQMLLPILGFTFVVPSQISAVQSSSVAPQQGSINFLPQQALPVFEMSVTGVMATMQETGGEFIVLKGSTAKEKAYPALSRGYAELRRQLFDAGKLALSTTGFWIFQEDVPFKSLSAAASVVAGSNLNGLITWKVKGTPETYKVWQTAMSTQSMDSVDGTSDSSSN